MWIALLIIYILVATTLAHHLSVKAKGYTLLSYLIVGYLWPVVLIHMILDSLLRKG